LNNGYDNKDNDFIFIQNDIITNPEKKRFLFIFYLIITNRYIIRSLVGKGTFGQVGKCEDLDTGEEVAIKVIKNKTAYLNQGIVETKINHIVIMPDD
jgi:dual specificity protein kinase YAK1